VSLDGLHLDEFHGDENRQSIQGDQKVRLYFAQLGRALGALHRSIEQGSTITSAESQAVDFFVRRLRDTLEALALKHFYGGDGSGSGLAIDTTDSGFPHWSALLELAADLAERGARLAELPLLADAKRRMLEQIVEYSLHPRELQRAMVRRLYLEHLEPEKLFRAFVPGSIAKVGAPGDGASYFFSFATYDRALNRPFVYLVYFEWDGGRTPLLDDTEQREEIHAVAERTAAGRLSLLAVSHRLDELLPRMRPRIVKRWILGPYHSPLFTRNDPEGEFGALLERLAPRLPFALRFEAETLISKEETRVGAGWLSKGQLRQVFWLPESIDLRARGTSQLERYVLLPHELAQQVHEARLLEPYRALVIEPDEKIHGLD
jgi:hypothetical protein